MPYPERSNVGKTVFATPTSAFQYGIYSNVVPILLEHDGYAAASKTVEMGLTPISDTKFFIGEVIMKGMNA